MKLKLLTLLILWTTLSTAQNLYIPSFERYLFTATSDGSEGLRVNPANMGFRHKINFAVYLSSLRKFSVKNYETGLFLQTMNLGIGMKSVRLGDSTSLL